MNALAVHPRRVPEESLDNPSRTSQVPTVVTQSEQHLPSSLLIYLLPAVPAPLCLGTRFKDKPSALKSFSQALLLGKSFLNK